MRVAVLVGLFVVVLAGASACGGDDENGEAGGGAAPAETDPRAQERAESIVLKLSDFPDGWRASAAEEAEGAEELRECIGVDYSGLTRTGRADSLDFAMGESTEVFSSASVYADEQQASAWMDEYTRGMNGGEVEDCFQQTVEDAVAKNGENAFEVGEVDVGQLSFTPPGGVDEAASWQVVVPVKVTSGVAEGLTPSVFVEFVVLRERDTVAVVQTEDVLTEFDQELQDELVAAVAQRMTAAAP